MSIPRRIFRDGHECLVAPAHISFQFMDAKHLIFPGHMDYLCAMMVLAHSEMIDS